MMRTARRPLLMVLGPTTKARPPPPQAPHSQQGVRLTRESQSASPVPETEMPPHEASSPFNFKPRVRPRRLVMPVDPGAPFDKENYARSALSAAAEHIRALRKSARRQGAVRLAAVPHERTVADVFAFVLENAKARGFIRHTPLFSADIGSQLSPGPASYPATTPSLCVGQHSASAYLQRGGVTDATAKAGTDALASAGSSTAQELTRTQRDLWDLLTRTPLDSPVHGALALRGESLAEDTVVLDATSQFPRLRHVHHQRIIHTSCGLLPCCRAAVALGLVELTGTTTDVGLWRELNFLTLHLRWVAEQVDLHREQRELGMRSEKQHFFEGQYAAIQRIRMRFPAKRQDLQPRIEWLRGLFMAFVAFVSEVDGEHAARNLVRRLLCPELSFGRAGTATAAFRDLHPLNQIGEMRQLASQSTSGGPGAVMHVQLDHLRDSRRFPDVPGVVIDAVRPANALKEAQIILAYDPSIPPQLRGAPLNFEKSFTDIEILDNSDMERFAFDGLQRRSERRVLRINMTIGRDKMVIGSGTGRTEREAIDAAALHMVQNYYFRRFGPPPPHSDTASPPPPSHSTDTTTYKKI